MRTVQRWMGAPSDPTKALVDASKDATNATREATASNETAQQQIRDAQARQQLALDEENARVTAQQSALKRLFAGGTGRSLSDTALGTTLGG